MNCIIVDDEYPSIEELKYFIENFSSIKVIGQFEDSIKALQFLKSKKVDVIFLDINMPQLDGMALGKIINNFKNKPAIVFITAYRDYAVNAFEINAFDYILKPYSKERIADALIKLEKYNNNKFVCNKLTLWEKDKMVVINIGDICFCEANERETYVYTDEGRYVSNCSITSFSDKLPKKNFFKTHRSYIVNLDKIKEIIPWFNNTYILKLKNIETEVPVSRNNIPEFRKVMNM
jgi:Response regulator of the LytR/AlgR family